MQCAPWNEWRPGVCQRITWGCGTPTSVFHGTRSLAPRLFSPTPHPVAGLLASHWLVKCQIFTPLLHFLRCIHFVAGKHIHPNKAASHPEKKLCLCNLTVLETTRQQKYANQSVTRWKTHPSQKGCKSPRKKIVSLQSNYVGNHPSTEICKPVSDPNALHDAILLSIS